MQQVLIPASNICSVLCGSQTEKVDNLLQQDILS